MEIQIKGILSVISGAIFEWISSSSKIYWSMVQNTALCQNCRKRSTETTETVLWSTFVGFCWPCKHMEHMETFQNKYCLYLFNLYHKIRRDFLNKIRICFSDCSSDLWVFWVLMTSSEYCFREIFSEICRKENLLEFVVEWFSRN